MDEFDKDSTSFLRYERMHSIRYYKEQKNIDHPPIN